MLRLAERVGFEPTCPLRDKTLSRRPRYDHFGTSPNLELYRDAKVRRSTQGLSLRVLGVLRVGECSAVAEERLHQLTAFVLPHSGDHLEPVIQPRQLAAPH